MVTNASWIPVKPQKLKELPTGQIKYPMARKYQEHDGSLSGSTILNKDDDPYLEGLRDGGDDSLRKDAEALIAAIKKHELIEFIIE